MTSCHLHTETLVLRNPDARRPPRVALGRTVRGARLRGAAGLCLAAREELPVAPADTTPPRALLVRPLLGGRHSLPF